MFDTIHSFHAPRRKSCESVLSAVHDPGHEQAMRAAHVRTVKPAPQLLPAQTGERQSGALSAVHRSGREIGGPFITLNP